MKKTLRTLLANEIEAYEELRKRIESGEHGDSATAIRTLTWIFHAVRSSIYFCVKCGDVGSLSSNFSRCLH